MNGQEVVSPKLVGIIDNFWPNANNAKTRKRKKKKPIHYAETSEKLFL